MGIPKIIHISFPFALLRGSLWMRVFRGIPFLFPDFFTMRLCLVGTVHLDPDGSEKTLNLLRKLQPDRIMVDVSPYAVEFRQSRGPSLRRRLEPFQQPDGKLPDGLVPVEAQLEIPFEVSAAMEFAEETGARVTLEGDSEESRERLRLLVDELLTPENLRFLAERPAIPLADQVLQAWSRARRWRKAPATFFSSPEIDRADGRLASAIEACPPCNKLAFIGGWEHLPGLVRLLRRHEPEVHLPGFPP